MAKPFSMTPRELNFYERNIGNAVNLFTKDGMTHSGDIKFYDTDNRIVVLTNYIDRKYKLNGSVKIIESPERLELEISIIAGKQVTTKEDRSGRIVNYNQGSSIEFAEKARKLKQISVRKSKDQITKNHS